MPPLPPQTTATSLTTTVVGLVQMRCSPQATHNWNQAEEGIREAAARGARIVCLPELFLTEYFCQTEDHRQFARAEPIPGPTSKALGELAQELEVVLVASLFERRAPGLYHNSAVVVDATGELLGTYRKMHIPDDPAYYEKFYFTPGDIGFRVFPTRFGTIGVLICWDQWFPEAARLTALQGADLLFYPTAIGWHPAEKAEHGASQHDRWELIQRSHAVANGCFVAAVNRVGHEPAPDENADGIEFWGQSFLCGPGGEILERASSRDPEVLVTELSLDSLDLVRTHWPFLRDRRIDAYAGMTQRFLDGSAGNGGTLA